MFRPRRPKNRIRRMSKVARLRRNWICSFDPLQKPQGPRDDLPQARPARTRHLLTHLQNQNTPPAPSRDRLPNALNRPRHAPPKRSRPRRLVKGRHMMLRQEPMPFQPRFQLPGGIGARKGEGRAFSARPKTGSIGHDKNGAAGRCKHPVTFLQHRSGMFCIKTT